MGHDATIARDGSRVSVGYREPPRNVFTLLEIASDVDTQLAAPPVRKNSRQTPGWFPRQ
jgi:hypothetical protein